jgi:molecular chaperone HtpG
MTEKGEVISLADYIGRMKEDQKAIYYQVAPSRTTIEAGPYVESFKAKGFEVLYMYEAIDEYVVSSLHEFEGKPLHAVNSDKIDLGDDTPAEGEALSEEATTGLCDWLKETLTTGVETVRPGKRLLSSPALILTPDGEMTPQLRQMMRAMNKDGDLPIAKVILEINPRHPIIRRLAEAKTDATQGETAQLIAEQVLDNALLSAGLLEDPQRIVARTQKLMETLLAK